MIVNVPRAAVAGETPGRITRGEAFAEAHNVWVITDITSILAEHINKLNPV